MALLPSGAGGCSILPENFSRSPRYIHYNRLALRLKSFSLWPQNKEQTPQNLADAGFFFTGNGDNVRCFYCGGGLKNWLPGDDPFVEHARWFPGCEFIRKTKGSAFVDTVQENFPRVEDEVDFASANPSNPPSKQEDTELCAIVQRVLKTPAGQAIKEVFSDTIARAAVNKALQLKGWDEKRVNTELLSDIALDLSDIASSLPEPETVEQKLKEPEPETVEQKLEEPVGLANTGSPKTSKVDPERLGLQNENERLRKQMLCRHCGRQQVSALTLPCEHLVTCDKCVSKSKVCVLCHRLVATSVKVFF